MRLTHSGSVETNVIATGALASASFESADVCSAVRRHWLMNISASAAALQPSIRGGRSMVCGASARRLISGLTIGAMFALAAPRSHNSSRQEIGPGPCSRGTGSRAGSTMVSSPSVYTTTTFRESGRSSCTSARITSSRSSEACRTTTAEHSSPENLLRPFNVEVASNRARQTWETAGLRLQVSLGGGGATTVKAGSSP